jgi:hypothetical protein
MAHLRLTRTGGFAGMTMEASVDTAELDPDTAERILEGIRRADLDTLAKRGPSPGVPDAFAFDLDVDDGTVTRRLSFTGADVPEPLRPALEVLEKRLRARPR